MTPQEQEKLSLKARTMPFEEFEQSLTLFERWGIGHYWEETKEYWQKEQKPK
jgi:hypothetical protein